MKPTREEDFSKWYQQVIYEADLAENSSVRGCMVIKPYGYMIWENIQKLFDEKLKRLGVQNAYFPLLIPLEFLSKEADHIEGFAKECAVVTHHRLKMNEQGTLVPDGKLATPYVIRPTSEAIIGHTVSKWIQTYRDLPLKLNQWCNVMRWEMRPRMFLRTSEFLWQEGHTVFENSQEAQDDAKQMIKLYYNFITNELAMPAIEGEKTPDERFPGANDTYTVEVMMQDGKALQAATSHYLGQSFSNA
ncbi:MAG: proline--tRNA ligase, partial [Pedobacter sp.]